MFWKHFCPERFKLKIASIYWSTFYQSEDIDMLNNFFEEKVGAILETEAPMKFQQGRKKFANLLDNEISQKMKNRDLLKEVARKTDSENDWLEHRKERNLCTKMLRRKKDEHYKSVFEKLEFEKNVKGTYSTAKGLLGWTVSLQPNMLISGGVIFRIPLYMANVLQKLYKKKVKNLMRGLKRGAGTP